MRALGTTIVRSGLVAMAAGYLGSGVVRGIKGDGEFGPAVLALLIGTAVVTGLYVIGTLVMKAPELREMRRRDVEQITSGQE